jgi:SNW domain-containing protein 1
LPWAWLALEAAPGELTYDERLFNQDTGMDSGFADDQYNVYSGRLFAVQPVALSMLYRPNKHGNSNVYGDADEHIEKIASRLFVWTEIWLI